ncbi:MAG: DUF3368 domain-containing protein [Saprospiraceae bacterium]|nr:DUF3368 domain-containing protein [Saprospiraceae bacterium]
MVIVSDTSAITNLIQLDKLDLLHDLFGEVFLAVSVQRELYQLPIQKTILESCEWIKVEAVQNRSLLQKLLIELDEGEAESIVLAIEKHADYLIIDESEGRRIAQELDLKITGLLGVLVRGKEKGLIAELRPIMEELVLQMKFRIHPKLFEEILKQVGEL